MICNKLMGSSDDGINNPLPQEVKLLSHANGVNGQTWSVSDSSALNQPTSIIGSTGLAQTYVNPFGTTNKTDMSAQFNGNQMVDIPNLSFTPRTDDWTFECWFNASTTVGTLLSSNNDRFYLILYGTIIYIAYDSDNLTVVYTVPVNSWHHIAITSSSGTAKVYIDGVIQGQVTTNAATTSMTGFCVGGRKISGMQFIGSLSNVRFTKSVVYTTNFTIPTTKLPNLPQTQLRLLFDNNVVPNSASTDLLLVVTSGNPRLSSVAKFNTSLYFDGTSSVSTDSTGSADLDILGGQATIEMFMQVASTTPTGGYESPIYFKTSGGSFSILMFFSSDGQLYASIASAVNYPTGLYKSDFATFTHFAITVANQKLTIFVNGIKKYEVTHGYNLSGSQVLFLGGPGGYGWSGYLDEIRITKGRVVYNKDFVPPTTEFSL